MLHKSDAGRKNGLISQIRRASISVSYIIAKGASRNIKY